MNIECDNKTLDELEHAFRYNDAVLRHLTIKMKKAETTASPMMKIVEREEARKAARAEPTVRLLAGLTGTARGARDGAAAA